jgi:alpha-galactosidase
MKRSVLLCLLSLVAIVVSIAPFALAEGTVKVFLMAGQSNMEGNNTPADRLSVLICHANSDFTHATLTCGSTDIPTNELTTRFIDNNQILEGYNTVNATDPGHPVVIRLGKFLCTAGKLGLAGQNCGTLDFDLTDRYFATVCGYYYHAGNARFQWAYDPFKQMTTAMGLTEISDEGHLNDELISDRPDVTVLQFRASLQGDGTLSFAERKGALNVGFGSAADRYGPELSFGHYMGDFLNDDVLLLKVVQGGTDLRVDWKTPCSTMNTGNNLTPEELAQESLYDALIERARQIQNPAILAQYFPQYAGKTAQIAGFIWFQGWNDGLNDLNRNNYETNMTCLVNDIRADLFLPELPIVIAQSHVGDSDNSVQVAQAKVADEFDHTELAITDDLSGYYHFDNAAHLVIGQRMAKKMIALLNNARRRTLGHAHQAVRLRR